MNLSRFEQLGLTRNSDCLIIVHAHPSLFSPPLFSLSFFRPFER